jgi:5-(carboxyamino)imidazole ribonucleotide synthase
MLNLLGDVWQNPSGQPIPPQWDRVLALPGAHLHLYGKQDPRAGRKMGHLNLTADSVPAVRHTAQLACELLGLPGL